MSNSSFLSATPSPFVSVYFQTSCAFDSFVRIAFGPNGVHESREHQVVDEHGVLVVDAVVVGVDVQRNPADRIELAGHVEVQHVAAIFDDEHPAVAVERDRGRLLDDRIGEHQFQAVAGLKDELLQLLLGRFRQHRRLLRPVDVRVDRIVLAAAAAAAAALPRLRRAPASAGAESAPASRAAAQGVCATTTMAPARDAQSSVTESEVDGGGGHHP